MMLPGHAEATRRLSISSAVSGSLNSSTAQRAQLPRAQRYALAGVLLRRSATLSELQPG